MKAEELRRGNLVNAIGWSSIMQIESINNDSVYAHDFPDFKGSQPIDIGYLSGIPLTEDWLVKFGFERNSNVWSRFLKEDIEGLPTTMQMWSDSNEFTICRNGTYVISVKCESVHELQNLWHALTHEELTYD
jgi:hypothetical protein